MKKLLVLFLWLMIAISLHAQSIVIDNRTLIQKQMNKENTTYVITSAVNLNNAVLSIPQGCTIVMQGQGLLSNGTLKGNNTRVDNLSAEDVQFQGSFSNDRLLIDETHFRGHVDLLGILASFPNATIALGMDIAVASSSSQPMMGMKIEGNGHTIKANKFPQTRNVDVFLHDVVFDCSQAEDDFLYVINNAAGRFVIRDCYFKNIRECNLITARGFAETILSGNRFEGLLNSAKRTRATSRVILAYDAKGKVNISNNIIRDCFGIGIDAIGFNSQMKAGVIISGNIIENVTNGGIVINGGDLWNATISRNSIKNIHCRGTQFGEQKGAENSAINVHGFHNLTVEGNMISDCIYGSCFDFDGSDGTEVIAKGTGLKVSGNVCQNVCGTALFGVKDAAFENNTMVSVKEKEDALNFLSVLGCEAITIRNNNITAHATKKGSVYPIYLSNTSELHSGDITISGNTIESEGQTFLFCNQAFSGLCHLSKNQNRSLNGKYKLTFANNAGEEHINLLDADFAKSVSLKTKSNTPKLVSAKSDNRGKVKEIWIKASKDITLQEPATISLIALGNNEVNLWSSSYNNFKKGWTKISLEKYVQCPDSDYYITCSDMSNKTTLKVKVIMENPSAMKYY